MADNNGTVAADNFEVNVTNPESGVVNTVKIQKVIPNKGRGANIPKFYPEGLSLWKTADYVKHWGEVVVSKLLCGRTKQLCAAFTAEALIKEDGTPEMDTNRQIADFSDMFGKFSLRGETLTDLQNRIEEITGGTEGEGELMQALTSDNITLAKELKVEVMELRKAYAAKKAARKAQETPVASTTAPVTA